MDIRALKIEGAWELTPRQFGDDRGVFLEWFKGDAFAEAVGHGIDLRQANLSVSAAGVLRGVHFADVPPSQAKYVTCVKGAVLDVVVDIRVGSPTYGQWDSVLLDDVDRRAIYLSEGLGHAFCSLEDGSTVTYLCSAPYAPGREHGIHPLDPEIGIVWPTTGRDGSPLAPLLSDKDAAAPTLAEAREQGLLPTWDAVQEFRASLRG
ncbi:dTDP-4-dehydrorhamnose 3,5-epimerase [Xylanimonas cellulosilytica DSM 15894]|uniref:dTDP-4-dehydrorhamnose 3,5-epimerase n=1 Tax=Xylanimonas cellulosilytica (strain DSM 15894 / JCM 12276 / CECT 5975 / KCTC 9989 / LMG 20990 / NBRC 107835 / XIL07) TaxID=446471 RepID=D1BX07_XYLCX|nr:dTDP-4-dehydrorhamnose 3,5-epimerase [Xylanimonas cellulosilytica]ACZ31575.1 dTDP-4-dehydrorhamnose 3,5-epimerase [Xylanimonas cellulosilytica DSM 15894]